MLKARIADPNRPRAHRFWVPLLPYVWRTQWKIGARVLARIAPERKVRIDGVIAAARTTEAEEQLRISMEPDIETAASKLERIG